MKKFKFRLQSILDLKEQEEEAIQKELVKLQNKFHTTKNKIINLKEDKKNWQQELENQEEKEINLTSALRGRNYINYLTEKVEELGLKLNYWKEEISKCRNKLLDKSKERQVLTKLKERKFTQHSKEMLATEQKLNDELATNSFNRKGNGLQEAIF